MTQPEIREAGADDADALAAAYHSAYRENRRLGFPAKAGTVTGGEVRDWIQDSLVFVAEIDDRIVGGVRLEATEPDRIQLSRLGVHADWRGQGIGSQLLDRAEATARNRGYRTIWLTTPPDHPYLPDLYRERGYARTGTYPLEYRDYDEIVMEKPLD